MASFILVRGIHRATAWVVCSDNYSCNYFGGLTPLPMESDMKHIGSIIKKFELIGGVGEPGSLSIVKVPVITHRLFYNGKTHPGGNIRVVEAKEV